VRFKQIDDSAGVHPLTSKMSRASLRPFPRKNLPNKKKIYNSTMSPSGTVSLKKAAAAKKLKKGDFWEQIFRQAHKGRSEISRRLMKPVDCDCPARIINYKKVEKIA